MAGPDLSVYNMLRPQKSAFDYFLQGQAARQQYDANQQMMQARAQALQQAEMMNPLLLQQQQLSNQTAQQGYDFNEEVNPQKIREAKLLADLRKGQVDQSAFDLQTAELMRPLNVEQTMAQTDSYRASAASSRVNAATGQLELGQKRRQERQAINDQKSIFIADTMAQGERIAQESPDQLDAFRRQKMAEFQEVFGEPFDPNKFSPETARANAIIADQRAGNIEQIPGIFGASYNKRTGEQVLDPVLAQKAVDLKRKAEGSGMLGAKDIQGINKDLSKEIEAAQEVKQAYVDLETLKTNASPVAQEAGIIRLVKALDPSSTVTVAEGQIYTSSGGPAAQLASAWNRLRQEGRITDTLFGQIVDTAQDLASTRIDATQKTAADFLAPVEDYIPEKQYKLLMDRIPDPIEKSETTKRNQAAQSSEATGSYTSEEIDAALNMYKD